MEIKKEKIIKVVCPHYKGDGYSYCLSDVEFLFCEECNNILLKQMIQQKKDEDKLNTIEVKENFV